MARYVALLRAVNVGGRVVKMDRLRALLGAAKLRNVETVIASGNVLFDAAASADASALERRIERLLRDALGFEVDTFVRTPAEMAAVAAHDPFAHLGSLEAGQDLWVGFLKQPPTADVARALVAFTTETEFFHVRGRELYWRRWTRNMKMLGTGARIERTLGAPMTMRNVRTVTTLAERALAS